MVRRERRRRRGTHVLPLRVRQRLALELDLPGLVPVVVYQMGKVGSSAVVAALARAGVSVFHVHRMDAAHLTTMREQRAAHGWTIRPVPLHDRLGLELDRKVVAKGRPAKIVTLTREPIARNLSSYFDHLDAIWNTPDAHAVIPTHRLTAGFLERYTHDDPLTWFDDELLRISGLDVFAHDFPAEGHRTFRVGALDVLVMKSEIEDATKQDALARFLGVAIPPLERTNETRTKSEGAAYRRFLEAIRLPPDYVEQMLESRYTTHFYTPEEREQIRRRYAP